MSRPGPDGLTVDHLEHHLVDVHRVRVGREVVELPHLRVAGARVLGDRRRPTSCASRRPSSSTSAEHGCRRPVVPAVHRHHLHQRQRPGAHRRRKRRDRRAAAGTAAAWWGREPRPGPPGTAGSGRSWPGRPPGSPMPGYAAAEGLVGADVAEHVVAGRDVGEVHDDVGTLGQAHQQPVAVVRGEVDWRGQEPALVADLPHFDAGDLREVQDQEPRLAAVEEAEAVAALSPPSGTARCCR